MWAPKLGAFVDGSPFGPSSNEERYQDAGELPTEPASVLWRLATDYSSLVLVYADRVDVLLVSSEMERFVVQSASLGALTGYSIDVVLPVADQPRSWYLLNVATFDATDPAAFI